ncbi:hypothetical protein A4L28_09050 [Salmonella enterica subsp. enterica serovar Wangata]|nr:hypothetical protein [Salmonella enterica subsp. enterica serovar Wangata]
MTDKLDYRIPLTLDVTGELATAYLLMSPPAPFEYHFQQNGNTVGKLIIDCGRASFEGDADAAATTFIEVLRARWSRQWQERELRDCRRSEQLSLERIAELKTQLEAANATELKPAELINKFYERYPVTTFKTESERAEALGYFMAGAELQCFGEFVKYEELCGDE